MHSTEITVAKSTKPFPLSTYFPKSDSWSRESMLRENNSNCCSQQRWHLLSFWYYSQSKPSSSIYTIGHLENKHAWTKEAKYPKGVVWHMSNWTVYQVSRYLKGTDPSSGKADLKKWFITATLHQLVPWHLPSTQPLSKNHSIYSYVNISWPALRYARTPLTSHSSYIPLHFRQSTALKLDTVMMSMLLLEASPLQFLPRISV